MNRRPARTVEQHRAVIDGLIADQPVEQVPLAGALGRVLAEPLSAPIDLPPFDNSAMDGYAVLAADVAELPVTLPVTADLPAGASVVPPLRRGGAARIMTGAPTPEGTDLVVPVELTDGGTGQVTVRAAPAPGAHIRRRGEDVRAGASVLAAGTVLGPRQLGVAAALGVPLVPVRRAPRVLVLSTGSELVAPGTPLRPGQIYESNAVMLAAALRAIGAMPHVLQFVPDDAPRFLATVRGALDGIDLLVTTGGVSAGAYEVVKDALADHGVEFVKVAMQPGGPQGAGTFGGVPVVAFPGNPVSAFVSFEVFLRPALLRATGHPVSERPSVLVPLSEPVTSSPGRRQFRRALYDRETGTVRPWGGPGSHLLSWLAGADAMVVLPEDAGSLRAGDPVEVWLLD